MFWLGMLIGSLIGVFLALLAVATQMGVYAPKKIGPGGGKSGL